MDSRVSRILDESRDILSDLGSTQRYSTVSLLRLLNQGQRTIAKQAKCIKEALIISVGPMVVVYNLPETTYNVVSVRYNKEPLTPISVEELDLQGNWEADTGTPTHFIYDVKNKGSIRLYPMPVEGTIDPTMYDVSLLPAINDRIIADGTSGVVVSSIPDTATDTLSSSTDGEVTSVTEYSVEADGSVSDVFAADGIPIGVLEVRIAKLPTYIDVNTETGMDIPRAYDDSLCHFIAGHALRFDREEHNRALGNEELQLFMSMSGIDIKDAKKSSMSKVSHNVTRYNTGFN